MDEPSWETTVMARLSAGDAGALAEVYDQLASAVFSMARRVTKDIGLAEDVTQEVFCQLWERPDRYRPERASLRTFLGVLAHRRAVDLVRGRESRKRRDRLDAYDRVPTPDIAEEVGAHLEADEVRTAVAALPAAQREAITLAYFDGYTFGEVARLTHVPEGTAKSRIRLALAKLRGSNEPEGAWA